MASEPVRLTTKRWKVTSARVTTIDTMLTAMPRPELGTTTGAENRAETTFEFAMAVVAGYLIGRSLGAWFRARALHHHDLKEV